jgi:light-harvesting complex 1 beta chain
MADMSTSGSLQQVLKSDSKVFYGIFVVSFCVLLMFALFACVLPGQWRSWLPGAESDKSLIGGVRAAVYTFMSYLT